jgi:hypothetical protein
MNFSSRLGPSSTNFSTREPLQVLFMTVYACKAAAAPAAPAAMRVALHVLARCAVPASAEPPAAVLVCP